MTIIPQLISPTEAAAKLSVSKKTLGRLGFTQYRLNARIIRHSEGEILLWLKKKASTGAFKSNGEGLSTQPHSKPARKVIARNP